MRQLVGFSFVVSLMVVCACGDSGDGDSSGSGGSGASSSGSGATGASNTGGGDNCPSECFAPSECVQMCGDEPQNFGCCGCPEGMIDVLSCTNECGLVGTPCPGEGECGDGLACLGSVCAPTGSMCASPPGGVGCETGLECLQYAGQQSGICVTADDSACLCAGFGSFECPN